MIESGGLMQVTPTALVVEDELMIRMYISDLLESGGFHVVEASSGDEAKARLASGLTPDIVITDINMPGRCNGLMLAECVKAVTPLTPVVVISAHQPAGEPQVHDSFLVKPFQAPELMETVAHLVAGRLKSEPVSSPGTGR